MNYERQDPNYEALIPAFLQDYPDVKEEVDPNLFNKQASIISISKLCPLTSWSEQPICVLKVHNFNCLHATPFFLTLGFQLQAVAEKLDLIFPSFNLSVTLNADTVNDQLWYPDNPWDY